MTMHTPGPFFVRQPKNNITRIEIVDATGSVVASESREAFSSKSRTLKDIMTGRHMGDYMASSIIANRRQLADITLRAAGPELIAAAELVLKSFAYHPGEGPAWYEACRDAVDKATWREDGQDDAR